MSEMVEFKTDEGTCSARYNLYGSMLSDDWWFSEAYL
jgi:hypothetical protein